MSDSAISGTIPTSAAGPPAAYAEENAQKEELLRLIQDVNSQSASIESISNELSQSARLARDVSIPLQELLRNSPNGAFQSGQLNSQLEAWRGIQSAADQVQKSQPAFNMYVVAASGVTNTVVSSLTVLMPVAPEPLQAAREKLFQAVERNPMAERTRASMRRLGLDSRGGNARTTLQLLNEAQAAIERPGVQDGGPTSILITLRESIDAAITELVRRSPGQTRVPRWSDKVRSLGQRSSHSYLPSYYFDQLANQVDKLMDRLSGFKQQGASRYQLNELFLEGVTFLNALLDGIDEGKLRP